MKDDKRKQKARRKFAATYRARHLAERRIADRDRARNQRDRDPEAYRLQCAVRQANARAKKLGRVGRLTYADWLARLAHYENRCAFCDADRCHLDLEHIESLATGGSNLPENIAPACRPCNAQKWRRSLVEFCAIRGLDPEAILARARKPAEHHPR